MMFEITKSLKSLSQLDFSQEVVDGDTVDLHSLSTNTTFRIKDNWESNIISIFYKNNDDPEFQHLNSVYTDVDAVIVILETAWACHVDNLVKEVFL